MERRHRGATTLYNEINVILQQQCHRALKARVRDVDFTLMLLQFILVFIILFYNLLSLI